MSLKEFHKSALSCEPVFCRMGSLFRFSFRVGITVIHLYDTINLPSTSNPWVSSCPIIEPTPPYNMTLQEIKVKIVLVTNTTVFSLLDIHRHSQFFATGTFQHTKFLPWVAFVVKWRLENCRWENWKRKKNNNNNKQNRSPVVGIWKRNKMSVDLYHTLVLMSTLQLKRLLSEKLNQALVEQKLLLIK